jgi:hypothetical protein
VRGEVTCASLFAPPAKDFDVTLFLSALQKTRTHRLRTSLSISFRLGEGDYSYRKDVRSVDFPSFVYTRRGEAGRYVVQHLLIRRLRSRPLSFI